MLQFEFAEVIAEARAFEQLSKRFFEPAEYGKLQRYIQGLQSFSASKDKIYQWSTGEISTVVSEGESELDNKGMNIYATLSSIWDLRKIGDGNVFEIYDKASTRSRIFRNGGSEIACWNMDVASNRTAPGCYFHTQVPGWATGVPRFPGLAVSPFAVFEFALSEIFQRRWAERSAKANGGVTWRKVQRQRLTVLLQWATDQVDVGATSPWVSLKMAKPDPAIFL